MPAVVQFQAGKALTVRSAAGVFLGSLSNPNTARNYGIGIGKTAERLGEDRLFASVADDEVGESLELLWCATAVRHLERPPGVSTLLAGLERGARLRRAGGPGLGEADGPTGLGDLGPLEDSRRPVDRPEEVHLREKTLGRMLYETCARAGEIPGMNIEELELAGRRAPVKAKGAAVRRRAAGRARTSCWRRSTGTPGTSRLLPRLLRGRTRGPVFVTRRRPGPGKAVSPRDVCPDIRLARLRTGRPARYWTSTRPSQGRRAPAGTCTSGGTPA